MIDNQASSAPPRRLLALAAVVYTTFVIYGSLVPLEFRALPWDTALARFAAMPVLPLAIGSRADWVANLLLFVPLTYLWMGTLSCGGSRAARVLATALLIPLATALSVAIEFTQMYFPPRTASQNDIMAETLGALVGVGWWWLTASRFVVWLQSWQRALSHTEMAERLAWAYLAGLVIYNILPLDLTINPVDLFHKWREGRLNLMPFARLPQGAGAAWYEVLSDAVIWSPLALLWRLAGTRSAWQIWRLSVLTAVGLEAIQIFVYSRFGDVTDVCTAAIGAALGLWVGGRVARRVAPASAPPASADWLSFGLMLAWVAVVLVVFWFPFDFRTDGAFIKSRLGFVYRVPFETYYIGSEFRAITEVLHKVLFFAPLGGLLAWAVARVAWRWRSWLFAVAMLVLITLPAVVELGQVMLPEKVPDTVDALLGWLGGLMGYGLARRLLRTQWPLSHEPRMTHAHRYHREKFREPSTAVGFFWQPLLVMGSVSVLFVAAAHIPQLPYNVRELLPPQTVWRSACLLALAYYWCAAWPLWLARRRAPGLSRPAQLMLGLALYGALLFGLLYGAVPEESLHDLVGFPLLHWPGQWEVGLRWTGLAAVPGALLYLAAQTVRRWRGTRLGALHYGSVLPVLLLGYRVIVVQAATDNLTELMAAPTPVAFAALCTWLYALFLGATLLASPLPARWRLTRWLGVVVSLPMAAAFLQLGLAGEIDKYGQQFAAIQFLLSTDRQHYASLAVCWQRYAVLHVLVMVAIAVVQGPWWRGTQDRQSRLRSVAA